MCYRIDGKNTLSSSSSTSSTSSLNVNATNAPTIQSDFKDSNKKKASCRETNSSSSSVGTAGRIKEKKKDNHATPMETSDEEAQSMDAIGELYEKKDLSIVYLVDRLPYNNQSG